MSGSMGPPLASAVLGGAHTRPAIPPESTAEAMRQQRAARAMDRSIDEELRASGLNEEGRRALRDILCGPVLTMGDECATLLEITASEQVVEVVRALLRALRTYDLVTGPGVRP